MKLNFKQPKYVLPLLVLPFLCLFFYVYRGSTSKKTPSTRQDAGLNGTVGNVSSTVRKENLQDKLDAFRNTYKETNGNTAVNVIPKEQSANASFKDNYSFAEKKKLDSIDKAMKLKYGDQQRLADEPATDRTYVEAINRMNRKPKQPAATIQKPDDPMETFKKQMAYMDSLGKMNDPAYKAEKQKQLAEAKRKQLEAGQKALSVTKADATAEGFNTVMPDKDKSFIKAVIDENVTGYAGSRLRLRLLDDIVAGDMLIPKDTYIYALVSGFSEQRVTLSIKTILSGGKILPVKLEVYDLDGLPGLYVPASAFRDFTKDLGGSSIQGVTIDGSSSGNSQFIMSSVGKMFQSTSSAIADLIRKNKARMKYNSYMYLIDTEALQNAQNHY
ncbi:conjugative transposon protein TraM [Mucilaginibacter sp. Mucisp84]|uniref:conjugative transposon protein TraM n=1 Tax=Mucilaginibacter sp. Mucisp84 TaxID=3243058 RepID=UPI0039A7480E